MNPTRSRHCDRGNPGARAPSCGSGQIGDPEVIGPRGPVRSFAGVVAAEVESTHHLSRTLALSVALLVLLSGAFVLTAAREVAR